VRVNGKSGGRTVGAVTNSAVTARARTERRAAEELTGRAERDARIEAAAAQVSAAQDTIRANAERRALAVAAAQRAIAADRDERDANAAADRQILAAVRQLRADGLTVAKIADLLHQPAGQIRGLVKSAQPAVGGRAAAAAAPEGRGRVSKT
jgi:hypothetical protein